MLPRVGSVLVICEFKSHRAYHLSPVGNPSPLRPRDLMAIPFLYTFIVESSNKSFYYSSLNKYLDERGFLLDTSLSMQDKYKVILKKHVRRI